MAKPSVIAVKQAQAAQQQADEVTKLNAVMRRIEKKLDQLLESAVPAEAATAAPPAASKKDG